MSLAHQHATHRVEDLGLVGERIVHILPVGGGVLSGGDDGGGLVTDEIAQITRVLLVGAPAPSGRRAVSLKCVHVADRVSVCVMLSAPPVWHIKSPRSSRRVQRSTKPIETPKRELPMRIPWRHRKPDGGATGDTRGRCSKSGSSQLSDGEGAEARTLLGPNISRTCEMMG